MVDLRREIVRKLIHFAGLGYVPAILYFGKTLVLPGVILAFFIAIAIEFVRRRYGWLEWIVRDYEKEGIPAYIYFAVALIVVTGLFDESACIAAVTISLVGDGVAGVVKKFQSRNIASFSMFFFSIIALFCLRDYLSLFPSLVACLCATITERIEKVGRFYINDNLSVPVVAALIYSVVSATVG